MNAKTIAIIGGGPSGLSSARFLLAAGLRPTIFERKRTVGGLWAPREPSCTTTQLDPRMTTNATKWACTFSDYFPESTIALPERPSAVRIGEYLVGYAERYGLDTLTKLSTEVTNVKRSENGWTVKSRMVADDRGEQEENYDFLVIATGVMSNAYIPPIAGLDDFDGPKVHSSQYKPSHLLSPRPRKIVVVGGALSAAEITTDIALRISSARENIEVLHVFTQPPWVLPKLAAGPNPQDPKAPTFLAVDILFYDVDGVRKAPPASSAEEKNRALNQLLIGLMGGNQGQFAEALAISGEWMEEGPTIGLSESYMNFVREGTIKPILGRATAVTGPHELEVSVLGQQDKLTIADVDAIYFATGYTSWNSLKSIFSPELQRELLPATPTPAPKDFLKTLYKQTLHSAVAPNGGFVGMLSRPFFGMFELQARWLAGLFTGTIPWPSASTLSLDPESLSLKDRILQSSLGDYMDFMEQLSGIVGCDPFSLPAKSPVWPRTFAPVYLSQSEESIAAQRALEQSIVDNPKNPATIARHIFAQLLGTWNIKRKLISALPSFPDGVFTGTAEFTPRLPTFSIDGSTVSSPPPVDEIYTLGGDVNEYLYSESGDLVTSSGLTLSGKMRYIYRFEELLGRMTVWFAKPDEKGSVDYFFHEVDFARPVEDVQVEGVREVEEDGGYKAAGEHLCEKDWYWPSYRWEYEGQRVKTFWIRYKVRGPQKDYVAEAKYWR